MIPYGRQWIDEEDINHVVDVLRSNWLTTGPKVAEFEDAVAGYTGAKHAVAVSNGTAALHAAMDAIGIGPGDEVIVPSMTFAATANCVLYQRGTPVFADVDSDTLLLDPAEVESKISNKTKAIITVDYAGQPCDYDALHAIADQHRIPLVADACHALGAAYKGRKSGTLADLNIFSFHPAKHITTGEGGMITTNQPEYAEKMRVFRNHGITTDFRQRDQRDTWFYAMTSIGCNYRLTDIQCALGISQLKKLPQWLEARRHIAKLYDSAFAGIAEVVPLSVREWNQHAYHLYVVRLDDRIDRTHFYKAMRYKGIGVNVHYIPVHLHPYYRQHLGTGPGLCPIAETAYEHILSLPMYANLGREEVSQIINSVSDIIKDRK